MGNRACVINSSHKDAGSGEAGPVSESKQTPTGPDPESGPRVVFLPLSASDFDAGWSLDWSPELEAQPEEPPEQRGRRRRSKRTKR